MNLLTIKAKLIAFGAASLAVIGFFLRLKVVTAQRDKARIKAKTAEKAAKQLGEVIESDAEIEGEFSELEREAEDDIENGEMPDNIRNRNQF